MNETNTAENWPYLFKIVLFYVTCILTSSNVSVLNNKSRQWLSFEISMFFELKNLKLTGGDWQFLSYLFTIFVIDRRRTMLRV